MAGPGIANAQGFRGSGFNGDGGGHACANLHVDTSAMANPHPAFEIPFLRHRRCDANQPVVVLDQGFCEGQGYDAFLLDVELAGGAAPIGKAVDEFLVPLSQGDQGGTNFPAQAKTRRLDRIKAPILMYGVGPRGIGLFGQTQHRRIDTDEAVGPNWLEANILFVVFGSARGV